jgi:hypothetical protein
VHTGFVAEAEETSAGRPPGGEAGLGRKHNERPGAVAILGTLAGIGAVIAALAAVTSERRVASALLGIVAVGLILTWSFSPATETRWFRAGIKIAVIAALASFACYLFIVPSGSASHYLGQPRAPKLFFTDGASARVPYCRAYIVQASGTVPPGFQVVMFDAPTDGGGNVNGDYNYDEQAQPIAAGRFEDKHLYIGSENNNAGLTAVVIAAVIADREAKMLNSVQADPHTGWGLNYLPPLLARTALQVTRNSDGRQCQGISG